MAFVPQNFVDGQGPVMKAVWLNGLDVTVSFVLGGAQTLAAAQLALGIPSLTSPLPLNTGGTGQSTAPLALAALGGTTLAAAVTASVLAVGYPQTPAELAAGIVPVNTLLPPGYVDRYATNTTPGTTPMDTAMGAAISQAAQFNGAAVNINDKILLANSLAVPVGTSVIFTGSGSIVLTTGQTLTLNGPFWAMPKQVFFNALVGQGTVILPQGSCLFGMPEWWGAIPNSTPLVTGIDCSAAITACIQACSGGTLTNGVTVGVTQIQLSSGYYLTGPQLIPPASVIRGTGRKVCGFVAKAGSSGTWFGDTGNAAGIILTEFALYGQSASCPAMTNNLKLGYNGTVHGSEGYIYGLWVRDCACSGGGWHLDINQNIGFYDLISVYGNAAQSAGSNLIRFVGVGGNMSKLVALAAGANAYSFYINAAGAQISGLEIEAPNGCSSAFAPLSIQANAFISGALISANNTANTTFDHLWEVGANATSWKNDLQLIQSVSGFVATVTGGNAYNIAKAAYFGSTLTTTPGNTLGSGLWGSGYGNALSGSVTFGAAVQAINVTLPWSQGLGYKIALSPGVGSGAPAAGSMRASWSGKLTSQFTINLEAVPGASNSVVVDWELTL